MRRLPPMRFNPTPPAFAESRKTLAGHFGSLNCLGHPVDKTHPRGALGLAVEADGPVASKLAELLEVVEGLRVVAHQYDLVVRLADNLGEAMTIPREAAHRETPPDMFYHYVIKLRGYIMNIHVNLPGVLGKHLYSVGSHVSREAIEGVLNVDIAAIIVAFVSEELQHEQWVIANLLLRAP
eukprot:124052-Amorphochlora_amoeboformis.AAC.1